MHMKKLFILMAITLSPYLVFAQSTVGIIDVSMDQMYTPEDKITVMVQYIPAEEDHDPVERTTWSLMEILDDEGKLGDVIFSEELSGEPKPYTFEEPVTKALKEGHHYQVLVIATDAEGRQKAGGIGHFYYMSFSLNADEEFCCNGAISATAGYSGPPIISHQWVLTECDAQGNINPPSYFY
jgi:hypothetical protein